LCYTQHFLRYTITSESGAVRDISEWTVEETFPVFRKISDWTVEAFQGIKEHWKPLLCSGRSEDERLKHLGNQQTDWTV